MGHIASSNYKFIGFFVSPKLLAAIKSQSDKEDVTMSALLRKIISKELKCKE